MKVRELLGKLNSPLVNKERPFSKLNSKFFLTGKDILLLPMLTLLAFSREGNSTNSEQKKKKKGKDPISL